MSIYTPAIGEKPATKSHVGHVLATWERNERDDSDFLALFWDPEKKTVGEAEYATTRFYCEGFGATVDATPEVFLAVRNWMALQSEYDAILAEESDVMKPYIGALVRNQYGRKDAKREGVVVWIGNCKTFHPTFRGGYNVPATGKRVCVKTEDGSTFYTNWSNVQIWDDRFDAWRDNLERYNTKDENGEPFVNEGRILGHDSGFYLRRWLRKYQPEPVDEVQQVIDRFVKEHGIIIIAEVA